MIEVGDSNVVVEFLAWIDQTDADWHKARTEAIIAVKEALEDGGFGLPEPIYRLRIDPRSKPLPFTGITVTEDDHPDDDEKDESGGDRPMSAGMKKQVRKEVKRELQDVAPDNEIVKMVDKERASDSDEGDLLDDDDPSRGSGADDQSAEAEKDKGDASE